MDSQTNGNRPARLLAWQPHQIIIRPLVTEERMHRSTRHNAYAFEVNRMANGSPTCAARSEELFNVKVVRVHTQNHKGDPRRTRWPRLYERLEEGDRHLYLEHQASIDFF